MRGSKFQFLDNLVRCNLHWIPWIENFYNILIMLICSHHKSLPSLYLSFVLVFFGLYDIWSSVFFYVWITHLDFDDFFWLHFIRLFFLSDQYRHQCFYRAVIFFLDKSELWNLRHVQDAKLPTYLFLKDIRSQTQHLHSHIGWLVSDVQAWMFTN